MFSIALMPTLAAGDPEETPGQRAFRALLGAVEACLAAGAGRPHRDPRRLASLVWATEHGLVSARLARPQFHWGGLDGMVTEAVSGLMGFDYEDVARSQPTGASDSGGLGRKWIGRRRDWPDCRAAIRPDGGLPNAALTRSR